jgi:penicillin-binding protein 1A
MKKGVNRKTLGWIFRSLFLLALAGTVLATLVGGIVFWHFSRDLPQIITVADYRPLTVTRILGAGGREDALMGEFFKERRYVVPFDKLPEILIQAFISAEDDQFFQHQGVNLASIIRASVANFRAGHVVQGGSTITQQVAKSLLLTPEKSFVRKIKEVILASRIERNLSKQQILYLYLNQIYLGHGAYGVQAAARTYFRKDVSELALAEAALLAGLPQAPGKYSPLLNPKRAKERQLYVLRRMYENNYVSQSVMAEAAATALKIHHDEDLNNKYAGYYVEHVRRYLLEKYGEKAVYEDGLTVAIPTTPELSLAARNSVRDGLRMIDKRVGWRGPVQKLGSAEEVERFLKEYRIKLIYRRLRHDLLMPDGRTDALEAMRLAGVTTDAQLLEDGEIYPAVVTSVDDKKKMTAVMVGAVRLEMPLEKMKWARPLRDEKNPNAFRPEPSVPSKVVAKGDVVLVRAQKGPTEGTWVVSLEQEPQVQGAILSLEAQTGHVLAMEGGFDHGQSEFNRATQAMRQPGSAFKPIIYSAALEKGFTPASVIVDAPIVYDDAEWGKWKPTNFEEKFYGDTTFRQALIKSRNVPTVKILQAIQVPYLVEYARRLGLAEAKINADLSISLGSASVSLMELTGVYALFPRMGRKVKPIFISRVVDRDGRVLEENKPVPFTPAVRAGASVPEPVAGILPSSSPSPRPSVVIPPLPTPEDPDQVMDPRLAYVMSHLMKEVVTYGTGHEAKSLGRPAAGKTGTTNDYVDAWFMGFTPTIVTGAWVGFDNQRSLGSGETGAKAALPVWLNYMREAVKTYPDADFPIPPGVSFATIDPATGKLAAPNASYAIREAFVEGTEPTESVAATGTSGESQSEFLKEDID